VLREFGPLVLEGHPGEPILQCGGPGRPGLESWARVARSAPSGDRDAAVAMRGLLSAVEPGSAVCLLAEDVGVADVPG
jgi:hypothetical protein